MKRHRRFKRLLLVEGARWPRGAPGRDLLRRLNNAARLAETRVRITSGRRTAYEQWVAYQDYLRGGTLAAPCCGLGTLHQWRRCQKQCASNHCVSRAVDCEVELENGSWVDPGQWSEFRGAMRQRGLCLPVGSGETWHVEVGQVWRS